MLRKDELAKTERYKAKDFLPLVPEKVEPIKAITETKEEVK